MVTQEISGIINKFVSAVTARGIHVEKTYLFGSYATGMNKLDSDMDVAVISSDFGRDSFNEGKLLLQLAWRIDPRLHPVPMSSESFYKDTWIPLVHEIMSYGIEID